MSLRWEHDLRSRNNRSPDTTPRWPQQSRPHPNSAVPVAVPLHGKTRYPGLHLTGHGSCHSPTPGVSTRCPRPAPTRTRRLRSQLPGARASAGNIRPTTVDHPRPRLHGSPARLSPATAAGVWVNAGGYPWSEEWILSQNQFEGLPFYRLDGPYLQLRLLIPSNWCHTATRPG